MYDTCSDLGMEILVIMILTFAYFLVKVVSRYIMTIHRMLISYVTLDYL